MGESGSLCSPRELRPDSQPQPQLEESQGMRSALAFGGHNEGLGVEKWCPQMAISIGRLMINNGK